MSKVWSSWKGVKFLENWTWPWSLTLTFLESWPWTWPLFHGPFGAHTIYYWDALLPNSYRPNPMSQSFFTLSSLEDTFELPILRQQSQNLEEIVLRLTEALGLWGYDKVFIYDKWLERGKKVRRYHRTLFSNLFSQGHTAPHGYKQIGILWNKV